VFTNTLGGGMSSRLFQEVREKRGLCYSIYSFHAPYTDTGFFGLYTGTDPGDAPEMMEVIVDVINDAVETLTEAEIARAKAQMKAGLLMALESCSSRAEQLARHILAYGRPQTVEELVARIDAVSVESTRNAAHALLSRYAEDISADRSYPFIIFRESDGTMIGGITLANVRRGIVQAGTIGYWVGEPYAGCGYMTAALRVLLPTLFGELNLHRIEAACIPSNSPSIRVL